MEIDYQEDFFDKDLLERLVGARLTNLVFYNKTKSGNLWKIETEDGEYGLIAATPHLGIVDKCILMASLHDRELKNQISMPAPISESPIITSNRDLISIFKFKVDEDKVINLAEFC